MKLVFNYNVPDKYTGKEYVAGETYEFEEKRAKEILSVINRDTGLPFAKEVTEDIEDIIEVTNMTVNQLKDIAEQMGIEGYKSMKKDELIKAIEESNKETEITEEEVQAVANAIVKEATENDKTVEEVVNEIVEESNEEVTEDINEDTNE